MADLLDRDLEHPFLARHLRAGFGRERDRDLTLFAGRDAEQLIRQHREASPEPLRARRPDIPEPVAALVHRLLAKDPLRRPESAAATVEALVRLEIECFGAR
jgi:hypothetical protein